MEQAAVGCVVLFAIAALCWPRPKPPPVARQLVRFSESLFVGWFSEGMEWRAGQTRARITTGIPADAILMGAYFAKALKAEWN